MAELAISYLSIDPTTMEEISELQKENFPYFSDISYPHLYPEGEYPWHWHNAIQFFRILEGEMNYVLPSGTYTFRQGDMGFINCNILHMIKCRPGVRCAFEEHLFSPTFIGGNIHSDIMIRYVNPVIENPDFDIYRINPELKEYALLSGLLSESYHLYLKKKEFYEVYIREKISTVWIHFFRISRASTINIKQKASTTRLRQMLTYINQNYADNLTVPKIAEAGMCSYRECNRTFKTQLHTTPMDYLLHLRIRKSCELLLQTQLSITDISGKCGFNSSSYFTKIFHQHINMSPREYRQCLGVQTVL